MVTTKKLDINKLNKDESHKKREKIPNIASVSLLSSNYDVITIDTRRNEEGLIFRKGKQQTRTTLATGNLDHDRRKLQQDLQQCKILLVVGDSDRDNVLSKNEYLNVVNKIASTNQDKQYVEVSSFDELSTALKENYNEIANDEIGGINISGSKPGQVPTSEQDINLNELCVITKAIVFDTIDNDNDNDNDKDKEAPPLTDIGNTINIASTGVDCSATVDRGQCNVDLSISDSYQNDLLDRSDYVRFVNRLSSNEYAGAQFEQLPKNINENYNKFATKDSQVDISGSKPGQRVSIEQDSFLDAFCCETDWAAQNPGISITLEPTAVPKPSESEQTSAPTFDLFFCQRSMASSDLNRDDKLNEEEYVVFLNRLTANEFIDIVSFDELDITMRLNFNNLAKSDGEIDIYGSKPGQTANIEDESSLVQICLDTAIALSNGSTPTVAPATFTPSSTIESPIVEPPSENMENLTLFPTFGEFNCYSAMGSSDSNDNNYLNDTEYVDLVNRLTGDAFKGVTFADLPPSLQLAYEDLESENRSGIYIYGSKPEDTADNEQEDFLQSACVEVAIALTQIEGWTSAPSMSRPASPSISPGSTFAPGFSEVYNSFIIANRGGLTAAELTEGTSSRNGLDEAYGVFAQKSIDTVVGSEVSKPERRRLLERTTLRRRKLEVGYLTNSNIIYLIVDSECPDNLSSEETCQTAFAKFQVTITNEDPQLVSTEYTEYTQALIADRVLDIILNEVDTRTILKIVNASFPVIPNIEEPTVAPTNAPTENTSSDRKKLAGPIIGGILGAILLCAIIGYVFIKGCPFSLPSLRQGGGRVGNKADDDDDDEEGLGFGQDDDDDVSVAGKEELFGKGVGFGVDNGAFGSNDEGEQEQSTDADKNVFGFTKKLNKKNNEEDHGFGLDSQTNSNANSFGASDNMYAFDEPSEADSETKDQDQRSVGDNEDIIFGDTSPSPAWGNSDNAFPSTTSTNQGWGANGGEDNFFGTSAFGEEQNEEQFSHSGSESESYSSEDDTYESGDAEESEERSGQDIRTFEMEEDEQDDSYSGSSADDEEFDNSYTSKSLSIDQMNSDLRSKDEDMDAAIEKEDWDAVVQTANMFDKSDQESSVAGSSKIGTFSQDDIEDGSYSDSYSSRSGDASATSATTITEERERRSEYRAQVDSLVRQVLPDETEKVDAMMDQFKGREAELVSTLQTMQERSANQRARGAVHKSKGRPQQQNGAYSTGGINGVTQGGEGSTAGTAAIAAASLPIPASGMFDKENENSFDIVDDAGFGREDAFVDASNSNNEDRSEFSNEEGTSHYSDEYGSDSRSFYSEDGSRSYYSDEGSYYSGEEGSYYSEEEEKEESSIQREK